MKAICGGDFDGFCKGEPATGVRPCADHGALIMGSGWRERQLKYDRGDFRYYCPLSPCIPIRAAYEMGTGHQTPPNDEIIRQSRSFATSDAYWRHIQEGHFIAPANAPAPYYREYVRRG